MTRLLLLPVAAAALALGASPALADDGPRLVRAPKVDVRTVTAGGDSFVSIGASFRLDREFSSDAERFQYAIVVAPHLRAGQKLPDELFGGTTFGRIGARGGHCFRAEAVQLRKRAKVRRGARWQAALVHRSTVVGPVRTVTLRRVADDPARDARALGC
ncbi:MAG: hypothetical protein HZB46_18755 [Solirubrobacterales bacterium]|nr:hypothetical protein [Solirubrobacterales bacterium]